jgi:hypothetical protein
MLSTVEFANNTWNVINDETGDTFTADQLIGDFKILHLGRLRGKVHVAHGIPMEQLQYVPADVARAAGVQQPFNKATATRIAVPGTRRYRLMPGGSIEPFAM